MNIKTEVETFLTKKMTRKEFIQHIGLLLLSLFGIGNLLKYLGQGDFTPKAVGNGYGKSSFGGKGLKARN